MLPCNIFLSDPISWAHIQDIRVCNIRATNKKILLTLQEQCIADAYFLQFYWFQTLSVIFFTYIQTLFVQPFGYNQELCPISFFVALPASKVSPSIEALSCLGCILLQCLRSKCLLSEGSDCKWEQFGDRVWWSTSDEHSCHSHSHIRRRSPAQLEKGEKEVMVSTLRPVCCGLSTEDPKNFCRVVLMQWVHTWFSAEERSHLLLHSRNRIPWCTRWEMQAERTWHVLLIHGYGYSADGTNQEMTTVTWEQRLSSSTHGIQNCRPPCKLRTKSCLLAYGGDDHQRDSCFNLLSFSS